MTNDNDPITRTEKDTPTHTPNLTSSLASTSLAEAAPPPTQTQSGWTKVESKHRRKKPKKKKKNKTDIRTDAPTGESGNQPKQGPGRRVPQSNQPLARGSYGQSGGRCPPTETVVSGQCKATMDTNQPGTSRGPPADTRYNISLRVDSSAQHRLRPAAHPPNTHWRERGGAGAGVGQRDPGPRDPGPSSSQSRQKRDRLDDTWSPRGEHKKRKTDRQTGSYARATQSHLSVAVALMPRTNMTEQEAESIQGQIEEEIFDTCLKPETPGTEDYAPVFLGRAYLSEGVLKLWCQEERTLSWLQSTVPKLKSPREGTGLTLIRQADIPIRVRSALFVPNYKGDIGKLETVLSHQNRCYEVSTWTLYTFKRIQGRTPGLFLVLGIPKEQIPNIMARERRVAYSTGSIYIRFFTKEGVSDVPPKETHKPGEQTVDSTKTLNVRETDTPTDKPPSSSPESSISTVLKEIETVLNEEPPVPSPTPPNKPRWEETMDTTNESTAALTLQELLDTWAPKATD